MQARALLFRDVEQVEVVPVEVPDPGPGEVLIETAYSCISPGTELRCLTGGQPGYTFPAIPGYASTGRVIAAGAGVTMPVGTAVFSKGTTRASQPTAWGAHISHGVRPADSVFPLPDGVDLLDASISKLAAITYHGLRMSAPLPHERVLAIGLGPIGQLSARLHALTGAQVVAVDLDAERVRLAAAAGLDAHLIHSTLTETVRPLLPEGADVITDSTGYPALITEALGLARALPWDDHLSAATRYLVQGSYPGDLHFDYHAAFFREPRFLFPRDEQPRDQRAVLDLMSRGLLRVRDLISAVLPPEDAPSAYADLLARRPGLLTVAFRW